MNPNIQSETGWNVLQHPIVKFFTKSLVLLLLCGGTHGSLQAQYVSGDTSVCPGQNIVYTFAGGPFLFSLNAGGSITASTANTVTIAWGNVPAAFFITAQSILGPYIQRVTVEGDVPLACDDLINVSLDGNCEALITPTQILEGEIYPQSSFAVTVYNTNNTPVPGNIVNYTHVGKILKVLVRHLCTGNSCWGSIYVEDKYLPDLICNSRDTIQCGMSIDPSVLGFPVDSPAVVVPHPNGQPNYFLVQHFDSCGVVELSYYDVAIKSGCTGRFYQLYSRKWTATDAKGNTKTCSDSIFVTRGTLDSVRCPPSYDGNLLPALQCDDKEYECPIVPGGPKCSNGWNALPNGNPSPYDELYKDGTVKFYGTGYPINASCDHLAVTYRDIKIPICGSMFKLLRTWTIFDWCSGTIKECSQLIKVADDKPPIVNCPLNGMIVNTNNYNCTGSLILPIPTKDLNFSGTRPTIIDCSDYTYVVTQKPAINPDDCMAGPGPGTSDNITQLPNGHFRIDNMPLGCTWLYYTVTDLCGNVATCTFDVRVVDNLDPVAICDQHTVVTINELGEGKLFATSVDNGSFDNCTLDSMAIRRMVDYCDVAGNTDFGPSVIFCCEDLDKGPLTVVFRVWDKEGNFNDCMVNVTVQDKIAPEITCPPRKTVNCGTDIYNLNLLGRATAIDGCDSVTITYTDDSINFKCNTGTIIRRWRATDLGGRFAVCDQTIIIRDENPLTDNQIDWPPYDTTITGCVLSDANPDRTGKPRFPTSPCKNLISGYSDEKFYNVDGFCIKIIRHWKVIDWCLYDVNSSSVIGLWEKDQVIKVRDTDKPFFTGTTCTPLEKSSENSTCDAFVELLGTAGDSCTAENDLIWTYSVDLYSDGLQLIPGFGKNASGTYPIGRHRIRWEVSDACGNVTTCNKTFTIRDTKPPTPFSKTGIITVIMQANGEVTVWAKDLDEKSVDNCTPRSKLYFSFSPNIADSFKVYRCSDIPDGRDSTFPITIYVMDSSLNQEFCHTTITIQDNLHNVCPNTFTNGGEISGLIITAKNANLQNSNVQLEESQSQVRSIYSSHEGVYSFVDLPEGEDYTLKPSKNDDPLNGVSTADIVLIQKHILGNKPFTSPYDYIAADANNSQAITAADMAELRKLILGQENQFRYGQRSWRFVKDGHIFENPANPWENGLWPEAFEVQNLQGKLQDKNFMAVKVGDLNYTARTTEVNGNIKNRNAAKLFLEIDEKTIPVSANYVIPVYANFDNPISGFQLGIKLNTTKVSFKSIQSGAILVTNSNVGLVDIQDGLIRLSWNSEQELQPTSEVLFYIEVAVLQNCNSTQAFTISAEKIEVEAYTSQLDVLDIELRARHSKEILTQYELFQNIPNPFNEYTSIQFQAPASEIVKVSIYDMDGRQVWTKEVVASAGKNSIYIHKRELGAQYGVLYYSLETPGFMATRKMILTK